MFEIRPQKCGFYFRRKDRWELTKISAAVMGIEFAYAAETAFVSPTLLKIGKILSYNSIKLLTNISEALFQFHTKT